VVLSGVCVEREEGKAQGTGLVRLDAEVEAGEEGE